MNRLIGIGVSMLLLISASAKPFATDRGTASDGGNQGQAAANNTSSAGQSGQSAERGGSAAAAAGAGGGPITSVLAGDGLSGGGTSGAVVLGVRQGPTGAFDLSNPKGLFSVGPPSSEFDIPFNEPGARFMWITGPAAIRAGMYSYGLWDPLEIGYYSAAFNIDTLARGYASFAAGDHTTAWDYASAAFGAYTRAYGWGSFVAGDSSRAQGETSAAFGRSNYADGKNSFAAGNLTWADGERSLVFGYQSEAHGRDNIVLGARVRSLVNGAFVFGDNSTLTNQGVTFAPVPNSFTARAAGGVYFYTNNTHTSGLKLDAGGSQWLGVSDVNAKENFRDLVGEHVLAKLARMPIKEWNYKSQDASIRHVGPTAQDFHAAFRLGEDPLRIGTMDADGIALLGVQALEARTRALERENGTLRAELSELRALVASLVNASKE